MISVVIPHHYGILGADHLLKKCISSLDADEIIVVANDGMGYGPAVNLGLELCSGDYIVVANNDTWLVEGSLRNLHKGWPFSVPRIVPEPRDHMPRCFFGMTRDIYHSIYETYGYFYDERYKIGYWEDDDLIERLNQREIDVSYADDIVIHHLNGGGTTMKTMGEQKYFDENKEKFEEKWTID